jgi:DNA-directed RNA polymerase specialized sigma24 family protein
MKDEELLLEFLNLPPEGKAQVADLIESLRIRCGSDGPNGKPSAPDLAQEGFIGMWRDREDMQDSNAWVRNLREREWIKQRG